MYSEHLPNPGAGILVSGEPGIGNWSECDVPACMYTFMLADLKQLWGKELDKMFGDMRSEGVLLFWVNSPI